MASILTPINAQLPAQAFGQSASAIGAYEQLRGIREKRELEAQARQRQALVSQLTGRALSGDQGAAQQLTMVAPDAAMELQKRQMELLKSRADIQNTQAQAQLRQAELPQVQQKTEDVQRQAALRQSQVLKSAVQRIRENPQQYDQIASALVSRGLVPEGALPEGQPTPEQLSEFEASVDFSQELLQNPVKQEQLNGQLGLIDAGYGLNTPEGKAAAQRLLQADIRAKEARAALERQDSETNLPVGVTMVDPNRQATREEVKELRKSMLGSVPLLATVRNLKSIVDRAGFEWKYSEDSYKAQGLAAMVQLQLKEALELGALDADALIYMRRLLPDDPTQLNQREVRVAVDTIQREITRGLKSKGAVSGFNVDIDQALQSGSGYGATTPSGGLNMTTEQRDAFIQTMIGAGRTREEAIKALDGIMQGETTPAKRAVDIMPDSVRQQYQQPTEDQRSEVRKLLDQGMSVQEAAQEMIRRGASVGARQSPTQPAQNRQELKQMNPVRAAREALKNPKLLTPEERKEVIKRGIEGKGVDRGGFIDALTDFFGG